MSPADQPPPPAVRDALTVSAEQAAVVDHVLASPLTVADAGAGAGKTRTTVATVFELMAQRPEASIGQFARITFTNKAADELTNRLAATLREVQAAATDTDQRRRYADKKRDGRKLDSTDLLLRTEAVLRGPHWPAIIRKLTSRYRDLFVDEFQDTDPVQSRLVEPLQPQLLTVAERTKDTIQAEDRVQSYSSVLIVSVLRSPCG
jgi:ATP-dependent exoDNAse (exonuclease V) beta subunit